MDEIHSIVFTNKVLLEYSHAHLFTTYCLWLLSCNNRQIKWLHHKPKYLSGPSQKQFSYHRSRGTPEKSLPSSI